MHQPLIETILAFGEKPPARFVPSIRHPARFLAPVLYLGKEAAWRLPNNPLRRYILPFGVKYYKSFTIAWAGLSCREKAEGSLQLGSSWRIPQAPVGHPKH